MRFCVLFRVFLCVLFRSFLSFVVSNFLCVLDLFLRFLYFLFLRAFFCIICFCAVLRFLFLFLRSVVFFRVFVAFFRTFFAFACSFCTSCTRLPVCAFFEANLLSYRLNIIPQTTSLNLPVCAQKLLLPVGRSNSY